MPAQRSLRLHCTRHRYFTDVTACALLGIDHPATTCHLAHVSWKFLCASWVGQLKHSDAQYNISYL